MFLTTFGGGKIYSSPSTPREEKRKREKVNPWNFAALNAAAEFFPPVSKSCPERRKFIKEMREGAFWTPLLSILGREKKSAITDGVSNSPVPWSLQHMTSGMLFLSVCFNVLIENCWLVPTLEPHISKPVCTCTLVSLISGWLSDTFRIFKNFLK